MKAVLQRVSYASLVIEDRLFSQIDQGLLVLLGIEDADTEEDIAWLSSKIIQMRIFSDQEGKMNLALADIGGEMMIVSQFTLISSTKKGKRPSFIDAARPEKAIPLYTSFIEAIKKIFPNKVATGEFGADMKITLLNDGPVTIVIDSKNKV